MNTTNYIRIFRGDDSDALGYQTIVGTIKTDLDLTGCKAVFRFLGFYAEFNPIPEDKKLTIVIPAQASRGFPPGVGYASLKVFDSLGKIRTFTNRIPVIVDTMTPSCGCGEFEVSFSPFPELEPLKIFIGPNADDFDQYTGFVSKIIDRASLVKYGLAILADAMSEDGGSSGKAASPLAVKAAYDAIINELTNNYYNAQQTEEAIDRVAAYYITYTAAGAAFPTYASLANATTVYSGGKVRTPTRNDYCVVLADETYDNAEYRYIYAVADGQTTGSWQPQFPVEGVMTVDQSVTKNSPNPVASSGIWSAIWGTASTAFTSLYDWCVAQLAGKASKADATLTKRGPGKDGFSAWDIFREGVDVTAQVTEMPRWTEEANCWDIITAHVPGDVSIEDAVYVGPDALYLEWNCAHEGIGLVYTATRTALPGYQLGSQTDKPLASEAEAEALRQDKASKADVDPLLFAQYYPDGSVKSVAEFTSGIKYDSPDTTNRTITVKPFCNTGDSDNDNSALVGRVVIPPFVDAQGNPYISDDGTRYKVVGVSGVSFADANTDLTAIVAPTTLTTIGNRAFFLCTSLTSISLPSATTIGESAFRGCTSLTTVSLPDATTFGDLAFRECTSLTSISLPSATTIGYEVFCLCTHLASVSLPAATTIWDSAFYDCTHLASVSLPAATTIGESAFRGCTSLASVDFGDTPRSSVPTLGEYAFYDVPTTCAIIVPDAQYNAWTAEGGWSNLVARGYRFLRHSEWEYARKYETVPTSRTVNGKALTGDVTLTGADIAVSGTDTTKISAALAGKADVSAIPDALVTKTINNGAVSLDDRASNSVTVSATLSPNTLTINFPTAPTGKLRDFAMRLNIAAGVTAPEIAWPQGVTLENDGGEVPEIADGGTGGSSTILYFSETENDGTTAKFLVKGEALTAITRA